MWKQPPRLLAPSEAEGSVERCDAICIRQNKTGVPAPCGGNTGFPIPFR